jgi:predicted 3-demethylubiquinone-9 3-methyltransferase (glyoxalase superfamily)
MSVNDLTPCLWFNGRAEEAAELYVSLFPDSKITDVSHYGPDGPMANQPLVVAFELQGRPFMILNGGPHHQLSPAFSISVSVDTQEEVDRLWDAFAAEGGEPSQCGWITDRFGVSWQVVPEALPRLLGDPDPERAQRALAAMMQMGKLDVAGLERAADGG